ncbi:FGGY-family carbohydrate kinase [Gluconobacter japonicus]|uniref:Ribulokinase n=1 Tax=Gluconobacter japonicus TaxID=376620 RepID=A0ABQ5WLR1_GLUJA|nr:FGGY-family carbohydrate kinase [Gluconobacter japonicus]KXV24999.1 ribulokinase [Gluconobacter japonicus]GBR21322.1 ribulokinase [Gluconobacter japonicus NBRC 3271]GLQ60694.1 ribulokinase [Gluconobacter japonicus]
MDLVLGVDVGTGSARAGLFTLDGEKKASAVQPTRTWTPAPNYAQQSSANIWEAVCTATRAALSKLDQPYRIVGIGFDATCSLVVLDPEGRPLSVDPEGADGQDIILWADHRALKETTEINAGGYDVLRYVGGKISPEMETPKLLWLKRNLPDIFAKAGHFFDLPDFLTWRATGSPSRSACSTACKWTYLAHEDRWDDTYFKAIGLEELTENNFSRIGNDIRALGGIVGEGLSAEAAAELGLEPGIPVGVSAIDAHAGGIGVFGIEASGALSDDVLERSISLICGTSSCHMAASKEARFVPGVWGPYWNAMLPDMWLNEAGQSATGALIDFVISKHAAGPALKQEAEQSGTNIYALLNDRADALEQDKLPGTSTANLHVLPDFHGNRSPHADPDLKGVVSGLSLSATADDLAKLYLATLQGLAYGTKDIIDALNAQGYRIDTILATGGSTKNHVFLREHANATGCRILLPEEPDSVLLGAAILGAVASGEYADLRTAMARMSHAGTEILPDERTAAYHAAKRSICHDMLNSQLAWRQQMRDVLEPAPSH